MQAWTDSNQEIKRQANQLKIQSRLNHQLNHPVMPLSITQVVASAVYLLTLCAALVWTQDCPCGLPGTQVKFKGCKKRPAEWREHDHPNIGLTGDCLPDVPVK